MISSTDAAGRDVRGGGGARFDRGRRRLFGLGLALGLSAGIGLAGCAPTVNVHGHMPNPDALPEIKVGATSRDQVRALLGSPTSVATFDDKRWYYISRKTETGAYDQTELLEQEIVVIDFDDGGFVKAVDVQNGTENTQDVAMVSRVTPTKGRELGFFEQVLGNFGGGRVAKKNKDGGDILSRSPTRR
jgi:outer membrane protein assembly factor BamE (lipoprotein component of BamABCDE complex)